jgi:hypothetical protein
MVIANWFLHDASKIQKGWRQNPLMEHDGQVNKRRDPQVQSELQMEPL